jgi:hypothetical protein
MSSFQPDLELDVIVRHVAGDLEHGAQWAVFLGPNKRVELASQHGAMVFARLLADLQQRRVWVCHDSSGVLSPIDHAQIGGCSCC